MARQAQNTAAVLFPVGSAGDDATHYGFWTALAGGTFLGGKAITANVAALGAGERYRFPATMLEITANEGDFNDAMANRALDGMIAGTLYISIHDSDPGTTGANEIAGATRQSIAAAGWTESNV